MSIPGIASMYPTIAVYRQGMKVQALECAPSEHKNEWGVYVVEDYLALEGAEAVVVAFNGADISHHYDRADVVAAEARLGRELDPARESDPAALERLAGKLGKEIGELYDASRDAGVVMHCYGAATGLRAP